MDGGRVRAGLEGGDGPVDEEHGVYGVAGDCGAVGVADASGEVWVCVDDVLVQCSAGGWVNTVACVDRRREGGREGGRERERERVN